MDSDLDVYDIPIDRTTEIYTNMSYQLLWFFNEPNNLERYVFRNDCVFFWFSIDQIRFYHKDDGPASICSHSLKLNFIEYWI